MNSVTPIISLTKIIHQMISDEKGQRVDFSTIDPDDADDILSSITTIESRSKGLLHFVHAYRSLTKIQKPNFETVQVQALLDRVKTLMKPEMDKRKVQFTCKIPEPTPVIQADVQLIEQVLINLVKNCDGSR